MRILYHHRTRSRDGQRVHIDGLIGALRRAGHDVDIVGPPPKREPVGGEQTPGSPRRSFVRELTELAYNAVEHVQLMRAAARFRPDALYSRHALFVLAPGWVARRLRLPLVVEVNAPFTRERTRHGGLVLSGLAMRLENSTLNGAGRVIVVTKVMAEMLVAQGVDARRIEVHWNGLEPDALRPPAEAEVLRRDLGLEGRNVLGFVGYVRDWNRLDRTYPFLVRRPNAVLALVGDGPDRPRLSREAERLGIADRVRFLGTVPRDKVLAHVALFDVALLPETPAYTSPLKLLDYLVSGRAILAPDRPNIREVIIHDENGYLFDPQRTGDFDAKLEALLESESLRRRLGSAARATIDRFGLTWDHNAERVVAAFSTLRG